MARRRSLCCLRASHQMLSMSRVWFPAPDREKCLPCKKVQHIHIHTYIYSHTHMYIHFYTYTDTHTHIHIHLHTYIHTFIRLCSWWNMTPHFRPCATRSSRPQTKRLFAQNISRNETCIRKRKIYQSRFLRARNVMEHSVYLLFAVISWWFPLHHSWYRYRRSEAC